MNEGYYESMEKVWEESYPSTNSMEEMDSFYREFGLDKTPKQIIDELMKHVPEILSGMKILDFGCDNGIMLNYFTEYSKNLYGVDINEKSIGEGKKLFPNFKLFVSNGIDLDFEDGFFDVIFVSAVLKHIRYEDREKLYNELKRAGKYLMVFEKNSEKDEVTREHGFSFYNSDFEKELGEVFIPLHVVLEGDQLFGLYGMK